MASEPVVPLRALCVTTLLHTQVDRTIDTKHGVRDPRKLCSCSARQGQLTIVSRLMVPVAFSPFYFLHSFLGTGDPARTKIRLYIASCLRLRIITRVLNVYAVQQAHVLWKTFHQ